ncbi:Uncharacterised protein [Salmonella enterica subsp. enterica serovar Bovismorbificans]|uniref:Uncharacterized protein n=1 Tax=Salmonella enterica subsp. enterica serovar Bovismorbificans TaxID=58097 RepID=A0A655BWP1_SALET|nr:Uncharacterised protein [Salmonella enterica subsp. enterica serovar Bovismorbificans]
MKFQILPHGEFVIERKSLRHIPDPATGIDVVRVYRLAK